MFLWVHNQNHITPSEQAHKMPNVIAVLNPKGGSGKTTLAIHLAYALKEHGRTLLVDADIQGSARDWSAAGSSGLPVIGLDRPTLDRELQAIGGDYQWIVIDGASKVEKMVASGVKAADMILIPVQPSALDLWACAPLVDVIQARQQATDGRPAAAFVVVRAKKNTSIAREMRRAVEGYGLPLLPHTIYDRTLYARAITEGTTVQAMDAASEAANEIRLLTNRVLEAFDGV